MNPSLKLIRNPSLNLANFASLLMISGLLNACAPMGQESFSSSPGSGFGWKSMQVNHQLIQQMADNTSEGQKPKILSLAVTPQPYLVQAGPLATVQRAPEHVIRVWFAPYQDEFGNLHEETAIHTLIQTGQWSVPDFSLDERLVLGKETL